MAIRKVIDALVKSVNGAHGAGRYAAMEGLRAYAVLLAFFVHYFSYIFSSFYKTNPNAQNLKSVLANSGLGMESFFHYMFRSHYGVDIFFIISGFLIYKTVTKRRINYFTYMRGRFERLLPVMFVGLVAAIAVKCWLIGYIQFDYGLAVKELLLFEISYNHPSWSLRYEITFYALIPAIAALIAFASGGSRESQIILLAILFVATAYVANFPRFAMFYVGVLIAMFRDDELRNFASAIKDWAAVSLLLSVTTLYAFTPDYQKLIPAMAVAFGVFFISVVFGTGALNRLFSIPTMRFIGNISYSFYIIHVSCIGAAFWLLKNKFGVVDPAYQGIFGFMLATSLSVLASWLMFLVLELPYFRRHAGRKNHQVQTAA